MNVKRESRRSLRCSIIRLQLLIAVGVLAYSSIGLLGCSQSNSPGEVELTEIIGELPSDAQLLGSRSQPIRGKEGGSENRSAMWVVQTNERLSIPFDRVSGQAVRNSSTDEAIESQTAQLAEFPSSALNGFLAKCELSNELIEAKRASFGLMIEWRSKTHTIRLRECQFGDAWITVVESFVDPKRDGIAFNHQSVENVQINSQHQ